MICLICGKDFNSVGCHLSVHGITAREYKFEFNIPLGSGLNEEHVTKRKSQGMKGLHSEEYFKHIAAKAKEKNTGAKKGKRKMPRCSHERLRQLAIKNANIGGEAHRKRCKLNFTKTYSGIIKDYQNGATLFELRNKYGVSLATLKSNLWGVTRNNG